MATRAIKVVAYYLDELQPPPHEKFDSILLPDEMYLLGCSQMPAGQSGLFVDVTCCICLHCYTFFRVKEFFEYFPIFSHKSMFQCQQHCRHC